MSCALWLHNYGWRPLIIEREGALGGMALANPYDNEWLLGRPGESGRENAAAFAAHVRQLAIETWIGAAPRRLRTEGEGRFLLDVDCGSGVERALSCPLLVVATGTGFAGEEWLQSIPNARRLAALGWIDLGATRVGEPGAAPGSHVTIIGGGDNAFDVSRMLAEKGTAVTIVMRSRRPRARPRLVDALRPYEAAGLARIAPECTVEGLEEDGSRLRLQLSDGTRVETDRVVLLLGYRPGTSGGWLAELSPALDAEGYLLVNAGMETSCRGLFAAGDVANPAHPCVAVAVASGAIAARTIQRRLAGCD
jgi:thioredoxin reductase